MRYGKSQTVVRKAVFERDNGVCSLCGLDTLDFVKRFEVLERSMAAEIALYEKRLALFTLEVVKRVNYSREYVQKLADSRILNPLPEEFRWYWLGARTSPWDVDHIEPRAGGGSADLSNLRTLCKPCHIVKTTAENAVHLAAKKARLDSIVDAATEKALRYGK